jgi:hypothetical protein
MFWKFFLRNSFTETHVVVVAKFSVPNSRKRKVKGALRIPGKAMLKVFSSE